jgi:hypothetical protein
MPNFGFAIESMVAILLLLTILYCVRLNKQLHLLKADEHSLRATISELVTATEIAERAIGGLKETVRECDDTLGGRLQAAEHITAELARQIDAGHDIMHRMLGVVIAARRGDQQAATPDPKAVVAAAHTFTERILARASGKAA